MIDCIRFTPADTAELIDIVANARVRRAPIQVTGGGTKQGIGFPDRETSEVSMARFDRIVDYDPAELVMTVEAGASLSAIHTLLAANGQMLAFEPRDFAENFGRSTGDATLGGIVAAGFAGSRRLSAGNVRDHVLGFTAVSGRAELFVAGGRVVKNVTGYDLPKLLCGSWGQLGVLTQVTFKVVPSPRVVVTLDVIGASEACAFAAMIRAARSDCEVAAAAYLPPTGLEGASHTLLRLEGFGPSVEARAATLEALLRQIVGTAVIERCDDARSLETWSRIPQVLASAETAADPWWRLCVPATRGLDACAGLREMRGRYCVDWGGGLIWARLTSEIPAVDVRSLAERCGGHATLMDAPIGYRQQVSALHPEASGVASLAQRVRTAFDPDQILDPHRFARPYP